MADIKGIIKNFRKARVLVIGDLILDCYVWGRVNRISPEAPVPVVEVTRDTFMLGGAANVAYNIAALGGKAMVVGVAGRDRAGGILRELLDENKVGHVIFEDDRPTTIKTRVIAHNQQVVRFDKEDKRRIGSKTFGNMKEFLKKTVSEYDSVIISDYKKGVISPELIKEIVTAAAPKRKFIAVDPKVGNFHYYKGVSLITPNLSEASEGAGVNIKDEKTLLKAGKVLMDKLSCNAVLITRGEQGMSLFEKKKVVHIPTVARHVYDVTGAGDTVIAAFTLAYSSGAAMEQAALIANHAAGIVVGEVGAAAATPEKLIDSLKERSRG